MAGIDYCTVLPSWDFDRDPAYIVSYYFGQELRLDPDDRNNEELTDCYSSVDFNKVLSLQRTESDCRDMECLVISVTCKPQYRVSICGIHVVSNTRLVEFYDASDGYLTTCRGTVLRGPQDDDGGEEVQTAYKCRTRLEESQFGLSIKFPKTHTMDSFSIYELVFILHPELEDECSSMTSDGQINMDKVKDYIVSMGDNISDNARMFMKNVEDYQQRQSGLQGVMANMPRGSEGGQMMGLMSMFSMMGSQSQANNSQQSQESTNMQSEQNSATKMSKLSKLLQESRNCKSDKDGNQSSEQEEMYGMLQDICGKVTRMRVLEQSHKVEKEEEKPCEGSKEKENGNTSDIVQDGSLSQDAPCSSDPTNIQVLEQRLQQIITQQVQDTEERLKTYMDTKMSEIERTICNRIDQLLNALQKNDSRADMET